MNFFKIGDVFCAPLYEIVCVTYDRQTSRGIVGSEYVTHIFMKDGTSHQVKGNFIADYAEALRNQR